MYAPYTMGAHKQEGYNTMALQYTFAVPSNMLAKIKADGKGLNIIVGWRQYNVTHEGNGKFLAAYVAKDVKDACAAQRELTAMGIKSYERQV